jgi:hypothetical protein
MRAGLRPVKCGSVCAWLEFVERDDHVWKIAHEPARDFESRGRRSVVHCQQGILGEKRRHILRISTAPRLRVTLGESG